MEIKLGIFLMMWKAKYSKDLLKHAIEYPFFPLLRQSDMCLTIVDVVLLACRRADKINFVLDGIKLPLSSGSITCSELKALMRDEELLSKTTFWLECKQIPTDAVVDVYSKAIQGELSFKEVLSNYY